MPIDVLDRWVPPPDLTISYGDLPDHVADVRLPPGRSRGLILFFHGGFWRQAYDRVHAGPLATALAGAGFTVATPEFRRTGAPGGGWPGTFDDTAAAVRLLPALIEQATGAAPQPVILSGHSAGGHLALWAGGRARPAETGEAGETGKTGKTGKTGEPGVVGVVALAAVTDLAEAYRLNLSNGAVAELLGGGPQQWPDRFRAADPMAALPLGVRATLCHGDRDEVVPPAFSRRYVAKARDAGDAVKLHTWVAADHFDVIDPTAPCWPDIVAAFAELAPPVGDSVR